MKCSWFTLLLFFAMVGALPAQEPLITPDTPVDSSTLHQWLHSGDPRLIAWAADFARRTHDARIVAEMPAMLEHWTMPPVYDRDESQAAQGRAILAVLDTLIQENAQASIPSIKAVAPAFPAQASILIDRLPLTESRGTLGDWTLGAAGSWSGRTLARIASMILAKDPGPSQGIWNRNLMGFAASVVSASEEELRVTIRSQNPVVKGHWTNTCGDFLGRKVSPGWPQIYDYDLVENYPHSPAVLVVELDGDRIASRRFEENLHPGSCYGVRDLNSSTRHELIAHWLGVPEQEMTWQPVMPFTIVWTNKDAYQWQLGKIIESQREKLHATVEALRQRGFLKEGEATMIAPRLVVTIQCDIKPCPLP